MKIKKFDEIALSHTICFEMLYHSARRMINRVLAQKESDYKQAGITVLDSVIYKFRHSRKNWSKWLPNEMQTGSPTPKQSISLR